MHVDGRRAECGNFDDQLHIEFIDRSVVRDDERASVPDRRASMANGAATGRALRGVVDRIHERHRESEEKQIAELQFRVKALISDDLYNDTLMTRAEARHDTASFVRLGRDRISMNRQVGAMFDSLNVVRSHAGLEGIPRGNYHKLTERLSFDSTLAVRLDSLAPRRD